MLTRIRGGSLYAPESKGVCDILIAGEKIVHIAPHIDLPAGIPVVTIDARDRLVVPGLVDLHVHVLGGGGEGGFATRTPEITLSTITRAGVTTVAGCLGTDDITRHPEALLAKVRQLTAEGISACMYTGSYHLPPPTITGSVKRDIALIPDVIGVGELALSDHRSSQPGFIEFCQLAAQARVGGMIGGKAGLVHLHMGNGPRGLDFLERIVAETEIPVTQFLPTHLGRTAALRDQATAFGKQGGFLDFTARSTRLSFDVSTANAVIQALDNGIELTQLTLSSDANGSMPVFDDSGRLVRLAVGDITSLLTDARELLNKGMPLSDVLRLVTENPARRLGLFQCKGSLSVGKDADLLITSPGLDIHTVMARGRVMVQKGQVAVKGTFEP